MIRLLQVFLSSENSPSVLVSEVSIDIDTNTLLCTCPGFQGRSACKHVALVGSRIKEHGGAYPMEISDEATDEDIMAATEGGEDALRRLILEFGKVEIL